MQFFISTFLSFLLTVFTYQEYNLPELRNLLHKGNEKESAAAELFRKVGAYKGTDALLWGFKASAYALQANYSNNPFKKLDAIKTSSRLFTEAVKRDAANPEIRFMRYAVEVHTPKMLNLSSHLNEDKAILLETLKKYPKTSLTPEMARVVRDFLQKNCDCNESEWKVLAQVVLP